MIELATNNTKKNKIIQSIDKWIKNADLQLIFSGLSVFSDSIF